MADTEVEAACRSPDESSLSGVSCIGPETPNQGLDSTSTMLTVDFSNTLSEAARAEKLTHLAHTHPAFEQSRLLQEILLNTQHTLQRMPGVSAVDANELVTRLQEVGQIIDQETTRLVDALNNMALDQEQTDKAIARMSIEANLTRAKTDDQAQRISDLRAEVRLEREKRERVEAEAKRVLEKLEALGKDFKNIKSQDDAPVTKERTGSPDDLVRVGESASYRGSPVANKRQQSLVNGKRALGAPTSSWTVDQQRSSSQNAAEEQQVSEDGLENGQEKTVTEPNRDDSSKTPHQTAEDELAAQNGSGQQVVRSMYSDHGSGGQVRTSSGFQNAARHPTMITPPKFGPLTAGPPRAPAAMTQDRRWGNRSSSGRGASFFAASSFAQQPRKSSFQPLPRYAPNGQEMQGPHAGYGTPQDRLGSAYGQQRRDMYPSTPTSANRNRFGRMPDTPLPPQTPSGGFQYGNISNGNGATPSTAIVSRPGGVSESPVQMTERAVAAWNEQIMDFYAAIRHFVGRHASEPDTTGNLALQLSQGSLWPVLMSTYHPLSEAEAATYLEYHLRNENTKACVVTRVIIDYVVNRIWVPSAWTGSDPKTSQELIDIQRQLEATQGQPSANRQPLLDQQAALVGAVVSRTQGTPFHRHKVDEAARMLQATTQPLLNRFAGAHEARRDLERVAEAGWELSARMLASRLTFDFRFPDIGARFSCQSMLPIWPRADAAEIQAKHYRVAFVTTPVITCRNDTGAGISAHSVTLADVICMP